MSGNMEQLTKRLREALDPGAAEIIRLLEAAGHEAWAVGGCVRDMLLGREPKDWDVTTSASPEEIKAVFFRTFDTGIKHGTVSVRMFGSTYEVTTYRVDGSYADHRRPDEVRFTASLAEDLSRRDFTVNAMAFHPERGLTDLFDGQGDLRRRVVRCVGVPSERFDEDALRMLRALRFGAYLGFSVARETFAAIRKQRELLAYVSKERISEELNKILVSGHPEQIRRVQRAGLMPWCVPAFDGRNFPYDSLNRVPAERVLRWALFLQRLTPEETDAALRDLRFDNETRRRAVRLAEYRETPFPREAAAARHFLHGLGPEYFEELVSCRRALGTLDEEAAALVRGELSAPLSLRDLALGGKDLLALGAPNGQRLGTMLEELLRAVLDDPAKNERGALEALARALIAAEPRED